VVVVVMMKLSPILRFEFFVVALILAACGSSELQPEVRADRPRESGNFNTFGAEEFKNFSVPSRWGFSNTNETMATLSITGFSRDYASKLLLSGATRPGVLPQILAPSVRTEVNTNGAFRFLRDKPLGDSLLKQFATDENMAAEVRKTLSKMLTSGLANYGGSTFPQRQKFNFDHFVPGAAGDASFDVQDQAAKWNLVWSTDGLFTGKAPIDGIDHGLQLLHVLKTMSEWAYLLGLDTDGNLAKFGGLTKRWENNSLISAKAVASSDPAFSSQVISGRYAVKVPRNISAIDLALRGGERWDSVIQPVMLQEQANLWLSSANAFSRLRADQRRYTYALYSGKDPVFGQGVDLLPLAFLASMANLLDGPFLEADSQRIFAFACPDKNCQLADVRSIARLTFALARWVEATRGIASVPMDQAARSQIVDAQASLKKALQFSARALMGEMTESRYIAGRRWITVKVPNSLKAESAGISAEVIGTLAYVERRILNSPLTRDRIRMMANGHAASYFVNADATTSGETILWNARMLRELNRSQMSGLLPWLDRISTSFKEVIGQEWNEP
jgi:hypothetical protein